MSDTRAGSDQLHTDSTPFAAALARNLVAGLHLALGRPLLAHAFRVSVGQVLLALALGWVAIAFEEWLVAGPGSRFWIWGFASEAARVYVWLAAVALLAWACRRSEGFLLLLLALSYANLPVWMLCRAVEHVALRYAPEPDARHLQLFYWSALTWYALNFWRALALLPPLHFLRAGAAALVYVGTLVGVSEILPDSPMFYQETEAPAGIDIEAAYYRQPALVATQLQGLVAQDPARVDLYFVAMGAYASQDVFMREVQQVRDIAIDRLGLAGRTVSLINNRQTVDSVPLANGPNLASVLDGVAGVMDRDQDLLMLFVTSHGYEDASIAVEFDALGLNDIYADQIRDMLDQAGIRWRIVIVSACYSGSFIETLRSPDTLIMTAAAPDRSSFGCSHENTWTYFGRALFAEALAETRDLIAAFELARTRIAAREKSEGKKASRPQIEVGANIAEQLRRWQPPAVSNQLEESR